MKILIAALAITLSSVTDVYAQEASAGTRAMFPYAAFNKVPLPLGTNVWVNEGDDECTYGYWRTHPESKFQYAMPSPSDACFKGYRKARIIKIVRQQDRFWYKIEFLNGWWKGEEYRSLYAKVDDLYEVFNLPERWESHSKYFLALNW